MNYRFATNQDIDMLVLQRLNFLEIYENDSNYEEIRDNCYDYFQNAIEQELCDIVLAQEGDLCIGTGIIFYYDSVPSVFNVTGKNAYVTSMYVLPGYRRQGIGNAILNLLISKAADRGYVIIMLNASEMGKPMYEKIGFKELQNGMLLDRRVIK